MNNQRFDVCIGDEIGCLKHIHCTKKEKLTVVSKPVDRNRGIVSLSGFQEEEILCSRRDGSVQVYRNDVEVRDFQNVVKASLVVNAVKISKSNILVGEETGAVSVVNAETRAVSRLEESARGHTSAKPVVAMRTYKEEFYAIGGNERALKVYDIGTGKQRWKSKNVPNDFLSLRVPIYVSDLRVLKDGHRVLTATAHGQIRMYDMRSDNHRPVMEIKNEYKSNGAARVVMEGWKSICVNST